MNIARAVWVRAYFFSWLKNRMTIVKLLNDYGLIFDVLSFNYQTYLGRKLNINNNK